MKLDIRLKAFEKLHLEFERLISTPESIELVINSAYAQNNWFIPDNIIQSLKAICESIKPENINKWLSKYDHTKLENLTPKRVGLIMAGNIPLVGFHDMLSILVTGNILVAKLSSQDKVLPLFFLDTLKKIEPEFEKQIELCEGQFKNIDAIIATGSNNSSRYFDYYFGRYPNIIRKNRNSVAILSGKETQEELVLLGKDIFSYFGLGCRNVSKIFVPEKYSFNTFFESIFDFKWVVNNNKYGNNYEYNKTVYLLSKIQLLENGFLILKEDSGLSSPVAVLFYEYYSDEKKLKDRLIENADKLQCVVSNKNITGSDISFGQTQCPQLWDYSDNVDTIKFLTSL